MKKKNDTRKKIKRVKKSQYSTDYKRRNKKEPDLWKEIRTNLKPLSKAFNKFKEKRRIAKQKEDERRLKEQEKLKLKEEEALRLQALEEKRLKKEKKLKDDEERRLKTQEKQRLEEKRIRDERNERTRQEAIYRERLISAEEERIKQLKKVNELREEERKIIEERDKKIMRSLVKDQRINDEEQQIIKEEEQRLKKEEQRLKKEEQRLKEKEQKIIEEETIVPKEVNRSNVDNKNVRLNGTVKWYNESKGYGFIKREDGEKDVFVHFSAVQDSNLSYLEKEDQITFEIEYSDKGPSAINLLKIVNKVSHLKVVK